MEERLDAAMKFPMALPFEIKKGQRSLRRGRQSLSGAAYFLTMGTEHRNRGLENRLVTASLLDYAQHSDGGWILPAAVVMPDHILLLIDLTASGDLSEAVRLFKGRTAAVLRRHTVKWQRGFFDRRLWANEDLLPVFPSIFLNPYRAGLMQATNGGRVIFARRKTGFGLSHSPVVRCHFPNGCPLIAA